MHRPRTVTFLAAWVFLLGLLQCLRAEQLLQRRDFLAQFNLSLPLPYAIATAALWGVLLIVATGGLWYMSRWGFWLALIAVTASQAQAWLDRLVFARSDYAQLSSGFALGVTIVILAVTWGILGWHRRRFLTP